MENYLIIIRHTPSWVWILLAYLIYAGIKARQPRQQSLRRLLVLPIIFLCWGLSSILHNLTMTEVAVAGFVLALIIGLALGWMLGKNAGVYRADIQCFERAGSSVPLVLMLLTFCLRFYFSVQLAWFPALADSAVFCALSGAVGGITGGIFSGIALRLLNQMRATHKVSL
ncbi:hypothetical protein HC231_14040 [Brenneria izadpanahii]|uniref:DUF1453 domain-containing protein n=1 Tax=Brenneria izadpanahii TaxID=2722756 RepID=A0ABX7UZB1_9GAMM|nr:DUF6622 family protein [Brenneria izadpanahii]QTF08899.1 hypothetical protein HC231_14040 [Brenneria izadpanahii]